MKHFKNRTAKSLNQLKNVEDDWSKKHFEYINSIIKNYPIFYNSSDLDFLPSLKEKISILIKKDYKKSFYNEKIVKELIKNPKMKPSDFKDEYKGKK